MKPLLLKFSALGPYVTQQEIDFTKLSSSGLFLICGETGSGKTTILDAMTYALFGKSSGGERGKVESMRCDLAGEDTMSFVEFTFSIGVKTYRFVRRLKTAKRNKQTVLIEEEDAFYKDSDGNFISFFENPTQNAVNKKAEELIKLNYNQFVQVIMLPQGKFEKLLVSNSDEKEKLLVPLFGADLWNKVADELKNRVRDEKTRLDQIKKVNDSILLRYNTDDINQMKQCLDEKTALLTLNQKKASEKKINLDKIRAKCSADELIYEKFSRLEKCRNEYADLLCHKDYIDKIRKRIAGSLNAEKLTPFYSELTKKKQALNNRKASVQTAQIYKEKAENEHENALRVCDEISSKENDNEKTKKRITVLEGMRENYKLIGKAKEKADTADNEYKKAKQNKEKCKVNAETLEAKNEEAERAFAEKYDLFRAANTAYYAEISGQLAKELIKGNPCPVCGSLSHPTPAVLSSDTVTKEILDKLDNDREQAEDERRRCKANLKEGESKLEEATSEFQAALENKTKHDAEYTRLSAGLDENIRDEKALEDEISSLTEITLRYAENLMRARENKEKRSADLIMYISQLENADTELVTAEEHLKQAEREFITALTEKGFETEDEYLSAVITESEKDKLSEEINEFDKNKNSYETNILNLENETAGLEKPDIESERKAIKSTENELSAIERENAMNEGAISKMKEEYETLDKSITIYQRDRLLLDENSDFAAKVHGDHGVGLQRYVLGVMLSAVTAEANRLLQKVHDGRYSLYRKNGAEIKNRKSGLELEVNDMFTNVRRDVSTLSGGEKFLVSLALSMGLSTVVQSRAGGIRIDAMFIDEGFGSLDGKSVDDALSVLSQMRRSNGMVGIISHVDTLKENITSRIEITKTRNGSSINIVN